MPSRPETEPPIDGAASPRVAQQVDEVQVIEGGEVRDLGAGDVSWQRRHHARTASKLAFLLVWVMVLTFVLHYLTIAVLTLRQEKVAVEALAAAFNVWLPVITGFVGGAVTYYFTKERN